GKEAGAYGRQVESSEDAGKLEALEKAGKLKRIPFADRAEMKKLVDPVMAAYAKEIGADAIYAQINAIKWRQAWPPAAPPPADEGPDRLLSSSVDVADGRLGGGAGHPRVTADRLALHRPHPQLHLDRGDVALPVHLDGDAGRHDRHPRGRTLRGRCLA